MQRHLQKCFEGIEELTFQPDLVITHMNSSMKEQIKLVSDVNPLSKDESVRGVEEWLFEVQQSMKLTVK